MSPQVAVAPLTFVAGACGPSEIDRSMEGRRCVSVGRAPLHVGPARPAVGPDGSNEMQDLTTILPDFDYKDATVTLRRRASSGSASAQGPRSSLSASGSASGSGQQAQAQASDLPTMMMARPDPLDVLPGSGSPGPALQQGSSPAQFGQEVVPPYATGSSSLPVLSPSHLHVLSPNALHALAPSTSAGGTWAGHEASSGSKSRGQSTLSIGIDSHPRSTEGVTSDFLAFPQGGGLRPPAAPAQGPGGASSSHEVSGESAEGLKQRVAASIMVVEDLSLTLANGTIKHLSVEGAVHLCLAPPRDHVPLVLQLIDKHTQMGNYVANAQYLSGGQAEEEGSTRTYQCSIPLSEQSPSLGPSSTYLPLFKYRAADTLKPLPVQILTKSQLEAGGKMRILARISVNPSLAKNLSQVSLQVHVALPESVALLAEFTAKPFAQWSPISKIAEWRLQQLVPGQKLMLEGTLTLADPQFDVSKVILPPSLPVLFKCHSMDCSFSRIEVGVQLGSDDSSIDLVSSVQKRFRVSLRSE